MKASQLKIKGQRVLIQVDETETVTPGGLIIPTSLNKKEQLGVSTGVVLAIGSTAWSDQGSVIEVKEGTRTVIYKEAVPWCVVGDRVLYDRYSGGRIPDEKEEGGFVPGLVIINDKHVIAVIEEN